MKLYTLYTAGRDMIHITEGSAHGLESRPAAFRSA
jgi:hypothetical protein